MGKFIMCNNILENNLDADLICFEDIVSTEDINKINNYKTSSAKATETITARTIIAPKTTTTTTTIISNNNSLLSSEDLEIDDFNSQIPIINQHNNNLRISDNNLTNNNLSIMFPNFENNTASNLYEDLENDTKASFNENIKLEDSYIMPSASDDILTLPSILLTNDFESQIDCSSYTDIMYNNDITNVTFNDSENLVCIPPQKMHFDYSEQCNSNLSNSDAINIKDEEQMFDFNELLNDDSQNEISHNINENNYIHNNNLNINNYDNNNNNDFKNINNFICGEKRKYTSISNNNNDIKKSKIDKKNLRLKFDTNPRVITDTITTPNIIDSVISLENEKAIKVHLDNWFGDDLMDEHEEMLEVEIPQSPSTSFTTITTHMTSNSAFHTNNSSRNSLSPFNSCDSNSTSIKIEENPLSVSSSLSTYSDFSPAGSPNSSVTKRKRGRPPVDHSFRLSPTQLKKLPEHKRKYFENRFKNNEASRVSRRNRKAKDDELQRQHDFESKKNIALHQQENKLENIVSMLKSCLHSVLEQKFSSSSKN